MTPAIAFGIFSAIFVGSMGILALILCVTDTKDDWEVVWTCVGNWTINNITNFRSPYKTDEHATYEILYSKSRGEYKLNMEGYKPKQHPNYLHTIKKLNELKSASKPQ